ncbi:MAG: type I-E CRISPR-associated protein Cas5/CasD, partial [Acidobacteria bacterium]|nr:type I-E CRISPR-associated protein Cas5/CasD [Acidobacteriota bacterium]
MVRHIILRFEAPLMSFGDQRIDHIGPSGRFPAASMLTGLLANALGWSRTDGAELRDLQSRIRYAARVDVEGRRVDDFQTAQLGADDRGWTTSGTPDRRTGGKATYDATHIRRRTYLADAVATVALRLESLSAAPSMDDVAAALATPARPQFRVREQCLPPPPVLAGHAEGDTALEALLAWPLDPGSSGDVRCMWPADDAP